jgi:tetratricopeptide (TPR) repeat protein
MLDIQAEQHDQGQLLQELYEIVADLKRRHDLHPCSVRPRDGLALRKDSEREMVQDLMSRFRRLPAEQQRRLPALLNSLAQLEVVVGDLEAGQNDFQEVARVVADPISRAEAHHNVYRTALERRDWDEALTALRRAVALDPETFEPFPFARYEPQRILGAGGFGASFLCEEKVVARLSESGLPGATPDSESRATEGAGTEPLKNPVVVKVLRVDSLDRDLGTIFNELGNLQDFDHPALIRIRELDGLEVDPPRPWLVLDYFEGLPLTEQIARFGPLPQEDWLQIAWLIARALQGAHARGVLHRSLRPGCVLVRQDPLETDPETSARGYRWRVKVLDAALSLKRSLIHASASHPEARVQTSLGRSVARTVPFAPVEVVGRPKGQVWVGPHSDIYSFGRLCAFALTGRPDPDGGDMLLLAEPWRQLLQECSAWTIGARPAHFGLVLERLGQVPGSDELISRLERWTHEDTVAEHTAALALSPGRHSALFNRAAAYARQGEYDRAIADYTAALELKPEDSSLYLRRGQARQRAGDLDGAISDFGEALRRNPRELEAWTNRGLIHAQKRDYDRAIADYTEGLRIQPRNELLYFHRGNASYCKGDQERAIADYSEVVRIDPRNLWAFGNRGKAYQQKGELVRAIADFTRVLQLDPANVKALLDRATAHTALGRHDRATADYTEALRLEPTPALYHNRALSLLSSRKIEQALDDLGEALELDPEYVPVRMTRSMVYAELGRPEEALADLDEVVRLAPESVGGHTNRGNVLARLGRHEEALASYSTALGLNPQDATAYFNRANCWAEQGDLDRAIADYSAALEIDPTDPAAWILRGNAWSAQGEHELALTDYTRALEITPHDPGALCNRAGCLVRLGQLDQALADYTAAIDLDPANARAYSARAAVLLRQGEVDRALADLDKTIQLAPDLPRAWHNRGNVRSDRGEFEQAIADYTEALRRQPDNASTLFNRGIALAEIGEYQRATEDFSETIRLSPDSAAAYNNRGNARLRLGDVEGALADFTGAVTADPSFAMSYFNRGNVLCRLGRLRQALGDYTEAMRLEPRDVGCYLERGRVHSELGQYAEAIADNLAAQELAPHDSRIGNNLAWLWATSPQPEIRNGPRALEYALAACREVEDAGRLDTLAAAYAACGQFEEAARAQERALEMADEPEKADFQRRLELYRAGRPYVSEPPLS